MKKIIFSFIILIIIIFLLPQTVFGIGQMTKPIIVEDVMRGQEIIETLIMFNSGEKEETYQFFSEGDIKDWAEFYSIEDKNFENHITEISVPAKSRQDVVVKLRVPDDAPNGKYEGQLVVSFLPKGESQSGETNVAVAQRIGRDVSITVTDKQIIQLDTAIIPLTYDVKKNEPLEIKIIYDNQGNVSVRPDVQLKIIKNGAVIFNAIFPYPENENSIKPRERRVMEPIIWSSAGQENGNYRAEVKILIDSEPAGGDDFRFTIGYKEGWILAAISFVGFGSLLAGWFIFGLVLLIVVGALVFLSKPQKVKLFQKGFIKLFSSKNGKRRNIPRKRCLKLANKGRK